MHKIPAGHHRTEDTIKRSRFVTTIAHAASKEDAMAFVSSVKQEFPDASHNCWAYAAGAPGDTARVGLSDDGEPHGTAGKPMLSVLLHSDIGEIAVVVTRYFGGTKLGTGGLVRAYSGCVKNGLMDLPVEVKRDLLSLTVVVDYAKVSAAKLMIKSFDSEITEENYGVDVSLTINIPKENEEGFTRAVTDLTSGKVLIKKIT